MDVEAAAQPDIYRNNLALELSSVSSNRWEQANHPTPYVIISTS